MASKKREVQLQSVVNSQNLWDEMLLNKGLTVIDVYQAWCGPCKAVQALFRKLKNELNEDELLHFVVNGKIIAKIQGANAPLINRKVIALIDEEKKIAAGEMARPQYVEIPLVDSLDEEYGEVHYESNVEVYNMAVINPDAVLMRKNLEIKEKITKEGFIIEIQENMLLPEEVAREFYNHMIDEPDFEEFVYSMTNRLSCVLIISQGEDTEVIEEEALPQSDDEEEEEEEEVVEEPDPLEEPHVRFAPMLVKKKRDSLQEYMDRQHMSDYCHVEDDAVKVSKFIDILFPDFKTMKSTNVQRTLGLLYPEVCEEEKDNVLDIIQNEGFTILMQRQVVLSEEEARAVCHVHEDEDYFDNLIGYMCSNNSYILVLMREHSVERWKELIGPKTVEEAYASHPDSLCVRFASGNFPVNQFYGSSSKAAAETEIEHFFPPQSTLALIKPHVSHKERMEILKAIRDARFELTQMKEMHLTPEHASKVYFKITGKDFYKNVLDVLSSGMSVVMILTKWNAVGEWRRMMGPVDPEEAKLLSPNSLRARYGIDVLRNAVHGASNMSEAATAISNVFTESNFEN
ncbi:thioredoxin domain-containing protein 3 isoform X2 [Rattus norvegicus]|uniref:NME/NM23 family member 8 n=1 Tax=Rattus norvegicus TaxID=10116 RepID=F7EU06_RAT|nr:thioredoxin domain-containing protein 3 isoform X2 [Rattus norvegicus]|eukprot:XP_017456126.1 PREDICTED: thioredoxin domain-containing protein 3 isoform X2 [Rattus norvegicus]